MSSDSPKNESEPLIVTTRAPYNGPLIVTTPVPYNGPPVVPPPPMAGTGPLIVSTPTPNSGPLIVQPPPMAGTAPLVVPAPEMHVEPRIAQRPRGIRCNFCPRSFKSREDLEKHCQNTTKHNVEISPYLVVNSRGYWCLICDRSFRDYAALIVHCETSSRHAWCKRCTRVFRTTAALESHVAQAECHNLCHECDDEKDFEDPDALIVHLVMEHCYCTTCGTMFETQHELMLHDRYEHFVCDICGTDFPKNTDLHAHRQTHFPRGLKCIGCNRHYRTFSAMLVHLESGSCTSNITISQVNRLAHVFFRHAEYMADTVNGHWAYRCPSCMMPFDKLIRLYQHVESVPICSRSDWPGGCLDHLRIYIGTCFQGGV